MIDKIAALHKARASDWLDRNVWLTEPNEESKFPMAGYTRESLNQLVSDLIDHLCCEVVNVKTKDKK